MSLKEDPQDPFAAEDTIVTALVDGAIAPYAGLLTAALRDEIRDVLRDLLSTHPAATDLLAELKPPPIVASSGDVATEDVEAAKGSGRAGGGGA